MDFETFCLLVFFAPVLMLVSMFLLSMMRYEPAPRDPFDLVVRDLSPGDEDYVSDEDFLRACAPGVRPEVALKVRRIIAGIAAIPEHEIHPSHSLVDDLGLD